MALIICRECGKKYSNLANACPDCACPTSFNKNDSNPQLDYKESSIDEWYEYIVKNNSLDIKEFIKDKKLNKINSEEDEAQTRKKLNSENRIWELQKRWKNYSEGYDEEFSWSCDEEPAHDKSEREYIEEKYGYDISDIGQEENGLDYSGDEEEEEEFDIGAFVPCDIFGNRIE